eukprot:6176365-Pyramimonas_sp.AAC.1
MIPPVPTLEDPKALTDPVIQGQNHPKSSMWVKTVSDLGLKLSAIKDMQKCGLKPSKAVRAAHSDGTATKKEGKMAVAVNFCLGKI